MKTAIYLDEGNTQLVLTPENEWEKNILKMVRESLCQGGWYRHGGNRYGDDSLIIRLQKQAQIPQEPLNHMPSCS